MAVYSNNMVLNGGEVDRKLNGRDSGIYNNILLNRAEIISFCEVEPFIGSLTGNNIIPNNYDLQRRYYMKKGNTLYNAYLGTYNYYIYYDANWDSTTLNNLSTVGKLYNSVFTTYAESGYYYMNSNNTWCHVTSNGVIDSTGTFTPINPSSTWYYAEVYGEYIEAPKTAWDNTNQSQDNSKILYYYSSNGKWYYVWTYQTPSTSNYAQGIYMYYYNAAKILYRRFDLGSEQSDSNKYAYIITPSFNITGPKTTSNTAKTLTYSLTTQSGVAWNASISSGSGYASITSGSSGVGTGSAQSIVVSLSANSSSERSFTLKIVDSINGAITIYRTFSCTQAAVTLPANTISMSNEMQVSSTYSVTSTVYVTCNYVSVDSFVGTGTATIEVGSSSAEITWDIDPEVVTSYHIIGVSPSSDSTYRYTY